jgi:hypothetical protein
MWLAGGAGGPLIASASGCQADRAGARLAKSRNLTRSTTPVRMCRMPTMQIGVDSFVATAKGGLTGPATCGQAPRAKATDA